MLSTVFAFLPRTILLVLVIWQPRSWQRCPKYDGLRLRTCPSNLRFMSSACRMLLSVLFSIQLIMLHSTIKPHFHWCYLPFIAYLQCPSLLLRKTTPSIAITSSAIDLALPEDRCDYITCKFARKMFWTTLERPLVIVILLTRRESTARIRHINCRIGGNLYKLRCPT